MELADPTAPELADPTAPGTAKPATLTSAFFTGENLTRLLVYLCNTRAPGAWDPITTTVLEMLSGRLQLCLSSAGLIPFRGRASTVYPFHMMTPEQKEFLRAALERREAYCVCNDAILFHHRSGEPEHLETVSILAAMCRSVLASRVHEEHRVRVGVCNILLQRVQSSVVISKAAQQELNSLLFGAA